MLRNFLMHYGALAQSVHCSADVNSPNSKTLHLREATRYAPADLIPYVLGRKVDPDIVIKGARNPFNFAKKQWNRFVVPVVPSLSANKRKEKLVLLGSGWASMGLLKEIDVEKYEVNVVSPTDCFVFTPVLPSIAGMSMNEEVATHPITSFFQSGSTKNMEYTAASAVSLGPNKEVICSPNNGGDLVKIPYDILVVAVGANVNTFNIPGVAESALYLKTPQDAVNIREKILHNFKVASQESTPLLEKRKLLHFAVVGAGPTGVETSGEISHFISNQAKTYFPSVAHLARVSLIEMLPQILPSFGVKVSDFCINFFRNLSPMCLCLNSRVEGIQNGEVKIATKGLPADVLTKLLEIKGESPASSSTSGSVTPESPAQLSIPFGMLLWATGVAQVPFTKSLMQSIPAQKNNRFLKVTPSLAVVGVEDVYALGDCCVISPPPIQDAARILFDDAQVNHPCKAGVDYLESIAAKLVYLYPQLSPSINDISKLPRKNAMDFAQWEEFLGTIDAAYRPPPPTAQVALQQVDYLANLLNARSSPSSDQKSKNEYFPSFCFDSFGSLAHLGGFTGIAHFKNSDYLGGFLPISIIRAYHLYRLKGLNKKFQYLNCAAFPGSFTSGLVKYSLK